MAIITPRLDSVALDAYIEKIAEPIMREYRLLGILQAKGRIKTKYVAHDIRWRVRFVRRTPEVAAGAYVTPPFLAPVRHTQAVLPWRRYVMGEAVLKPEREACATDKTALPRLLDGLVRSCVEDIERFINTTLYKDGETSEQHLHGLESFFGVSGLHSGGEPVGNPNDNYAGLSTVLSAYGGTYTGNWPVGSGSSEYDFWSPMVVDYRNSKFAVSSNKEWDVTWKAAIRYALTWLKARQSVTPDVVVMHPDLLRQAKDSCDPYRELEVTAKSPIVDFGIDTVKFDGLELVDDPDCPSGTAYILPTQHMELLTMQKQLITTHQDTDPYENDTYFFDFIGNMRAESPAFFVKLAKLTTS